MWRIGGVQGTTARVAGSIEDYLDWAAPSHANLYHYTKDRHHLDVAKVLLHDTKSIVALSERQYDVKGIGWQQAGWGIEPGRNGRGIGGQRFWLLWISANHLCGITGLAEFDATQYQQLSKGKRRFEVIDIWTKR